MALIPKNHENSLARPSGTHVILSKQVHHFKYVKRFARVFSLSLVALHDSSGSAPLLMLQAHANGCGDLVIRYAWTTT